MRLLVTRPEPDAARTAAALRDRGHSVLIAPLLHIVPDAAADLGPGPFGAVGMTSASAARAIAAHPRRAELIKLPVFAVGGQTAAAAAEAGFGDVTSADGNASDLARLIGQRLTRGDAPLLYLAGATRSRDLAADPALQAIAVRTVVIYRAVAANAFPADVRAALAARRLDGVLHFSARSAAVYLDCAQAAGLREDALAPTHYCLSAQAGTPLQHVGARRVLVAPRPDEAALIGLMDQPAS